MVRKAHHQIRSMHPLLAKARAIGEPIVALEKKWESGWHSWRPHFKSWDIIKLMKKPLTGERVFVCGEAFSCDQGWIEGALRSAELVLAEYGLAAPPWLSEWATRAKLDEFDTDEYIQRPATGT